MGLVTDFYNILQGRIAHMMLRLILVYFHMNEIINMLGDRIHALHALERVPILVIK